MPLDGFKALPGVHGPQKFQIHRAYGPNERLPSGEGLGTVCLRCHPRCQRLARHILALCVAQGWGRGWPRLWAQLQGLPRLSFTLLRQPRLRWQHP